MYMINQIVNMFPTKYFRTKNQVGGPKVGAETLFGGPKSCFRKPVWKGTVSRWIGHAAFMNPLESLQGRPCFFAAACGQKCCW